MVRDLMRVWGAKLKGKRTVVLTTESEGLGGYLWLRSYYHPIREYFGGNVCIVLLGMAHWESFVLSVDRNNIDVFRPFESCDTPRKIERVFFYLFKTDYFIDVRAIRIGSLGRSKHRILGRGMKTEQCFYEEANNRVLRQLIPLPDDFEHKVPILPLNDARLERPYAVLVEGGHTQGKLSDRQLSAVAQHLLAQGLNIFFNGDIERLRKLLPTEDRLIDGYSIPLSNYGYIIQRCSIVVTPNTLIYHYAVQTKCPCVVLSANEYLTIKRNQPRQIALYNPELESMIAIGKEQEYLPLPSVHISQFDAERIIRAIDQLLITAKQ